MEGKFLLSSKKADIFYKFMAIVSIITLILSKSTQYKEELGIIGFCLFTILCIGIGINVRKSKWKLISIIVFWCIFGLLVII